MTDRDNPIPPSSLHRGYQEQEDKQPSYFGIWGIVTVLAWLAFAIFTLGVLTFYNPTLPY